MFKYFTKIFLFNILFFLLISITILTLNLIPLITLTRHTPPGRTFGLIHNNAQDFYFYLSLMNKGGSGDVLTTDPFTTEPHQGSIIFSYFVWLGRIASIFGIPYTVFYHVIRIFSGFILLGLAFFLIKSVTKGWLSYLGMIFFVFATGFMHTINEGGTTITVPFMHWWTAMDPIRRIAYLPHHMIGNVLLVVTILLILRSFELYSKKFTVVIIILFALLSFIHPPSVFILLATVPLSCLLYLVVHAIILRDSKFLIKKNIFPKEMRKPVAGIFVSCLFGGIFLLAMLSQTSKGFPWTQYIAWEKTQQFPLGSELLQAFGILLPLAFVGIISAFHSKKFGRILIAVWFLIPILLVPIASRIQISNIRLVQGVPYLPLAILSVFGLETVFAFLEKRVSLKGWQFKGVFISIILIIFTFFTYSPIVWSIQDQIREYWPIFGNIYLDNRLYTAFDYINNTFPKNTKTLGTFYTGNYLPAFTHTISFIGHFGYTYNITQKEKETKKFFENKMSEAQAKDFLVSNKIDLIWQGPEEKPIYKDHLYPNILKAIYEREEVTIYKIQERF